MPNEPDATSIQLAERLGAVARLCEVVSTTRLATSVVEVVLSGDATSLVGPPGSDVMIRFDDAEGRPVRRRYSVRDLNAERNTLALWLTVEHDGPGSNWVRRAAPGETVDVIGPRGKIPLDPLADWHLFVGDASGFAAFYRMAESITLPGRVTFVVEIDAPDDALVAPFDEGLSVKAVFIERRGRSMSDPAGLLSGLADVELANGLGHAYLFGEFHVMRVVQSALLDRGLAPEQISHKAFWRSGRSNADHGEPEKSDP